jgi:hypothetical protein
MIEKMGGVKPSKILNTNPGFLPKIMFDKDREWNRLEPQ